MRLFSFVYFFCINIEVFVKRRQSGQILLFSVYLSMIKNLNKNAKFETTPNNGQQKCNFVFGENFSPLNFCFGGRGGVEV